MGYSISAAASSLVATTPISSETEEAVRLYGGPGLWIDCGQYSSTQPGEPRPPEPTGPWQVAGQGRQLKPTPSSNLVQKIIGFQPKN
jgi:hypothetical protein